MKIIRHTARDMRQALRAVREQLGEDAVILSSRRTNEGVEVTAAVDFDASTLEAGGFSSAPGGDSAPVITHTPPVPHSPAIAQAPPISKPQVPAVAPAPAAAAKRTRAGTTTAAAGTATTANPATHREPLPELATAIGSGPAGESEWISAAAREAVAAHAQALAPPVAPASTQAFTDALTKAAAAAPTLSPAPAAAPTLSPPAGLSPPTDLPMFRRDDVVEQARASSLAPFGPHDAAADPAADLLSAGGHSHAAQTVSAQSSSATDAMGSELKTLRRMLETQLAHLAWNDLTRRAPVHAEILRELTEIGITQDLAGHLVRQLPEDTDLTFARRFTIAGLSQYLRVTGDRWLDDGARVAFAGSTGVGKTTTLAKVAVRWVLRHGPRDIALVAADSIRIGAQDQLQSLAQLLGVPVYTPERFESLPALLSQLTERLVLIDTPGSSTRDAQLGSRLAVLSNSASKLETALVLSASTQAGAVEEAVKRFGPANPSCCVLTKLDEAASLGGVLSVLIRAKLPVSYVSEGQRVPEDLRPARALELVSGAVRLAKSSGAAADEDLLRRRFGRSAHGIT
ncbi:MAG: hypothetical protein ACREVV_00675 [Steroidobacteraceae bacterium]